MGRNVKKGLDYFPFDVDFFQDIKIRKLIKYQRGKAVTVYALLLCLIYKNGYYMLWDEELPFILSEQTGFEEAYIQEVVKCCLALGLFSKNSLIRKKFSLQSEYKNAINEYVMIAEESVNFQSLTLFLPKINAFLPKKSPKTPQKVHK